MLAIDTNIVVRYLVRDDAAQLERATEIIEMNEVFVTATVVLETEWVLRDFYELPRVDVLRTLRGFCGVESVTLSDADAIERALRFAERGMELADALHLAQSDDCEAFVTFDKSLARMAGRLAGARVRLA
jgi:predicted nucleic-acid-binding protein